MSLRTKRIALRFASLLHGVAGLTKSMNSGSVALRVGVSENCQPTRMQPVSRSKSDTYARGWDADAADVDVDGAINALYLLQF